MRMLDLTRGFISKLMLLIIELHFSDCKILMFYFQGRVIVSLSCRPELALKKKRHADSIKRFAHIVSSLLEVYQTRKKTEDIQLRF